MAYITGFAQFTDAAAKLIPLLPAISIAYYYYIKAKNERDRDDR